MASQRKGFILLGLLLALIIIFVFIAYSTSGGKKETQPGEGKSYPKRAVSAAKKVACANNLRQIRMVVQVRSMSGETLPSDLTSLSRELRIDMSLLRCPENGEPYQYNPESGEIRCPCPGHESN